MRRNRRTVALALRQAQDDDIAHVSLSNHEVSELRGFFFVVIIRT